MERILIEDSPQFTEKTMQNLKSSIPVYHSDEDTLFIRSEISRPAVSYDWGGELWLRFDLVTKEIVGVEVENFESVFLKKHPEVAKVWKDTKPFCTHKKTRTIDGDIYESFIRILLSFLKDLFQNSPQQVSFGIA